ncbi:inactive LRR receptor-like serine/threonine-protein kinase BIR2 [Impatiens glandulifera]|uniref:inactive LRR receptor-like serine/threonine-protein kinase BIR2 n=1 Tax=Impatiens glandulifera TaxID=253017 RepID=UPI001FB0F0C9|nr:inactive LRR receptor-like serine/threonine-protein kinase BIR2 [Impatiens glandulifera]
MAFFHVLQSTVLLPVAVVFCFLLLLVTSQGDEKCLKGLKGSMTDPDGKLDSWFFTNSSAVGYLCHLVGVSCWNDQENRILALELKEMRLAGEIPSSLQYCHTLQTLDLSGNNLRGSIPSQLCTWLPFLVTLDLSNNQLSGQIPSDLSKCLYLNNLILSENQLSGSIPYELTSLGRLKKFSVAGNDLTGRIPYFLNMHDSSAFDGNSGLCGRPLRNCGGLTKKNLAIIIAAGVFGAVGSMLLGFGLWWWYFTESGKRRRKIGYGLGEFDDSNWATRLKSYKHIQVSLFQKPLVKVRFGDLMAATNNFCVENMIFSSRTGAMYKAVLADGSALAIKRLTSCKLNEKQFRSEMDRLSQLRHPNLVPLLGFCIVEDEKLLVYKHMQNGTLLSLLSQNKGSSLDWPTRFKIALGAARGLAWLHHGYHHSPILHNNISSNVIMVDEDFDARIVDFDLAKLMTESDPTKSSFETRNLGEIGYVAPECYTTMVASLKGDVYGFGIVLLELATGQKPLVIENADEEEGRFKGTLVDWIHRVFGSGRIKDAIDKSLCGRGFDEEIVKYIRIAYGCIVPRPKERWSMYKVYESLRILGLRQGVVQKQVEEFPLLSENLN